MSSETYVLTYFNGCGRAEVTRQMFKMEQVEFKDKRISEEEWKALKSSMPFKQVPILEVDGKVFCQSLAIERLVASRLGLYGENDLERARTDMIVGCGEDLIKLLLKTGEGSDQEKKAKKEKCEQEELPVMLESFEKFITDKGRFLNTDKIMWPDISIIHILSLIGVYNINADFSKYPKLMELKSVVESEPRIAAWIKARPKTAF